MWLESTRERLGTSRGGPVRPAWVLTVIPSLFLTIRLLFSGRCLQPTHLINETETDHLGAH